MSLPRNGSATLLAAKPAKRSSMVQDIWSFSTASIDLISGGTSSCEGGHASEFSMITSHNIRFRNLGILFAMMVGFCTIHLVAVEYIPAQRSKGEVLLFRRGYSASSLSPQDEEKSHKGRPWPADAHEKSKRTFKSDQDVFDTLQKQTAVFHWDSVSYTVSGSDGVKTILDDVDGWVKPGTLTALMVSLQ